METRLEITPLKGDGNIFSMTLCSIIYPVEISTKRSLEGERLNVKRSYQHDGIVVNAMSVTDSPIFTKEVGT